MKRRGRRTSPLRQAYDRLTPDERILCVWWKLGFSERAIARQLGLSASSIAALWSRAEERIKITGDR